jgi:glycosyltransferase involved in cell wall biosynthesis
VHYYERKSDPVKAVCKDADVILAWGDLDFSQVFRGISVPMVVLARGGAHCLYTRRWIRNALPHADVLAAVSDDAARAYPAEMRWRIRVIHNGVDSGALERDATRRREFRQAWEIRADQRILGYYGRVSRRKGIERQIQAMPYLDDRWRLVIAGQPTSQSYQDELRQACQTCAAGRYVFVPPTDRAADILSAFDVFALLSETEGFSNALLEAWAAGVPTVYTPVGAVEELEAVHGALGIRVPVDAREDDGRSVAAAVCRAYAANRDRVQNAQAVTRQLSISRYVQRWTQLLLEAAVRERSRPADRIQLRGAAMEDGHQQVRIRLVSRPRLAFVTSGLGRGGAERWISLLVTRTHLQQLQWDAVIVPNRRPYLHDSFCRAIKARGIPILVAADSVDESARAHVLVGQYSSQRRQILERVDGLVLWGTRHAENWARDFHGPMIYACRSGNPESRDAIAQASPYVTHFTAVSQAAASMLPRGTRATILWNGVDEGRLIPTVPRSAMRQHWGLSSQDRVVGYLGRMHRVKNPLAAVHAVSQLPDEFHAVLVGALDTGPEMREEARSICDRVTFDDFQEDVGSVLAAFDVAMVGSHAEGFSQAMVEAWLAGIPVVATPVGAVPELQARFGQLVFLVPRDPTPNQLAGAVRRALAPEAEIVVRRARRVARRYLTAESMVRAWSGYLRKVIRGELPESIGRQIIPRLRPAPPVLATGLEP